MVTIAGTVACLALRFASAARAFARALLAPVVAIVGCIGAGREVALGAGNILTYQLLDCGDRLLIERRDDRNRRSRTSRAAGAADAMNVIVGMMRDVKIEDVAYLRNIKAARCDVGSDQ